MERLTERELYYDGTVDFTKCKYTNCPDKCAYCNIPKEANLKLKEYEDAEEQGLLIKLPCKVGDTVYIIVGKDISIQKIQRTTIDTTGMLEFCTKRRGFKITDIGKTVFLTREEAEQALEKMKGE